MKSFYRTQSWPNQKWRWIIPILLLLLFLSTLIWLPWQAQRMEANERQEQLIADSLWVEQAIQFQLNRNDEVLRQIGGEIISAKLQKETVLDRFRAILKNNREVQRIAWYDANNKVVADTREGTLANAERLPVPKFEFGTLDVSEETICLKPVLEINAKNAYLLHCQIPLIKDEHRIGSMMISYRMNGILEELVPWWFAQDNQISITDIDDRVLSERAAGGSGKSVYTHSRALELPSLTLILRTNSIKSEPKLLSNLLVLSVILLSAGLIWSLMALWRDINRRLAAEGALRQQVTFRTAMENSLVTGLRARDMEGRLTYVNPAFCRMVGFPAEQIIGRVPPMPYWAPEAIEEYQQRFTQLLAGTVPSEGFETIYQHASGERIPVLIYESALINENGRQTGWMSSILDISELRRAQDLTRQQEEKLHTSAKLATMGEIASMLAHELNQPLAAISSYTTGAINLLQSGIVDRPLFQSALEKVNAQAQRAGHIIRSVHEFVKKREATREPVQITDLIHTVTPLVELQAQASHVALQWQILSGLPMILADGVLLEQVLLNLTRNAIESMQKTPPENRILRIETSYDEAMQQVIVAVIDRGHGIPSEVAEQLFSPFFTTKSSGMGMGLNICRTAVEFHGGKLSHRDNPVGGTIFQFALPIHQQQQSADQ
ncbi:PAS domain S-box protein [Undibacterium sp. CY18W]|uniref:histidine kinase n=1 Tax=Undibacterium hunanense TaxID=2762292 RepID=A0ABR6ZSY2_9BURK|nr:ATP-binding protein [Undibacterium hunanense]MBC3918924.1 PAS domain S-box protein [Undibacterium hunanense]